MSRLATCFTIDFDLTNEVAESGETRLEFREPLEKRGRTRRPSRPRSR